MIGLFGGAFDPPHVGHVALADAAQSRLGLSDVVVVVVADPGHKDVHCPVETRLALARAAFPDRPVEVDHHARTVDMLRAGRWDDPVFLIGADEYLDFANWKEPDEVMRLARLGVATRPGFAPPDRSRANGCCSSSSSPLPFPRARSGKKSRVGSPSTVSCRRPWPPRSPVAACTAARLAPFPTDYGALTD